MSSFKHFLRSLLLRFAKTGPGSQLLRWSLVYMSSFLPVDKVYESRRVVAFVHPQPAYRVHYLILPKQPLSSLMDISAADGELLAEIALAAQELVRRLHLEESGYRLIVNGGEYQEIRQLHFHLVAE